MSGNLQRRLGEHRDATVTPPAAASARTASARVDPVVTTSSTSRNRAAGERRAVRGRGAPAAFAAAGLARRGRPGRLAPVASAQHRRRADAAAPEQHLDGRVAARTTGARRSTGSCTPRPALPRRRGRRASADAMARSAGGEGAAASVRPPSLKAPSTRGDRPSTPAARPARHAGRRMRRAGRGEGGAARRRRRPRSGARSRSTSTGRSTASASRAAREASDGSARGGGAAAGDAERGAAASAQLFAVRAVDDPGCRAARVESWPHRARGGRVGSVGLLRREEPDAGRLPCHPTPPA